MPSENPYFNWVKNYRQFIESGKDLPLGKARSSPQARIRAEAPTVLLLSPHPDDECITGTLPLRLMRESGCRVVNLAVTLGSKKERRQARLAELTGACERLGFELENADPDGLEKINPQGREEDPANWSAAVDRLTEVMKKVRPGIVFMPHAEEWNKTHIGVYRLGVDALARLGNDFSCRVIECEFWHPLYDPNLMVECSDELLGEQLAALAMHAGEVARNPYHLSLPAWMHDNVRRGAECLGGQGEAAPDYLFATLYRLKRWESGGWNPAPTPPRMISRDASPLNSIE